MEIVVNVTVTNLDIENSTNCENDSLQIFRSRLNLNEYIYTCQGLPFNELLLSNCLHLPIKTFAHVTNVV